MRRRDVLKTGIGAMAVAGLVGSDLSRATPAAAGTLRNRVRPSDTDWPTAEDWNTLAESLDGTLETCVRPIESLLAETGGTLNSATVEQLQNPFLIQDYSGGTQSSGWHNGWMSSPSAFVVIPKNAQDVALAVKFAARHFLRVVVKGGAHSYLGQSNAPDSLMIWTRDLKGLELHDDFIPQGCDTAPRPAVSVASGEKFIHLYDFVVREHGRYVQGGGCTSVGVGGHLQTGGFGSYSKYGGMTCASLLEAEIVTADGSVRIVNECNDPDLFWAIKGGGAGWGVTTRVTIATHPLPKTLGFMVATVKARDEEAFRTLSLHFATFAQETLINPTWGEQVSFAPDNTLGIQMSFQGLDDAGAREVWKPFFDWVEARPNDYELSEPARLIVAPGRHWWDFEYRKANFPNTIRVDTRAGQETGRFWWGGNTAEVGIFLHGYESLWLPENLLANDRIEELADALVNASRHYVTTLHFNKGLAGATEERRTEARQTAVHPSAIDAFALVIIAGGQVGMFPGVDGYDPDPAVATAEADLITKAFAEFRRIAPGAGSYSSEMSYHEANWREAAWGEHYPRLLAIKTTYDPEGLFTGHHQVGSEYWSADGFDRI